MDRIMTNRLDRCFQRYQKEFEEAALRVLRSGRYILGEELERFEEAFAEWLGVRFCVGVGNGLDALTLACRACGIGEGDEVIVPANTFIASALAVSAAGAVPVFADVDEYYLLDPDKLESHITERTRAVMAVHLYGQTCRLDRILAICRKHGLKLLEDCAQSHGAAYRGRISGTVGEAGCFSFYPTKNLGAFGDAGAVVTDDEELYEHLKKLRNYGSSRRYYHEEQGVNSRLDELQAALLAVRLSHMKELTAERIACAEAYNEGIRNEAIEKPRLCPGAEHVYHQYVVRTKERDRLIAHLKLRGIDTLIHYPVPCHLQGAYASLGYERGALPQAELYADTVLSIPIYNGISKKEQQRVIEALNEF